MKKKGQKGHYLHIMLTH